MRASTMSSWYGSAASVRSMSGVRPSSVTKLANLLTSMSTTSGSPSPALAASCSLLCMSSYGYTVTLRSTGRSGFCSFHASAICS